MSYQSHLCPLFPLHISFLTQFLGFISEIVIHQYSPPVVVVVGTFRNMDKLQRNQKTRLYEMPGFFFFIVTILNLMVHSRVEVKI